jgi:hypothetical protein
METELKTGDTFPGHLCWHPLAPLVVEIPDGEICLYCERYKRIGDEIFNLVEDIEVDV